MSLAAPAHPMEDAVRLQDIIDSAIEREALADGMQGSFKIETVSGRVQRRGGGATTVEGTWAASAGRVAVNGTITRASAPDAPMVVRMTSDGEISKSLMSSPDTTRAFVSSGDSPAMRMSIMTPDKLGLTALPFSTGSLAEILRAEPSTITFNRRGETTEIQVVRSARVVGTEEVDGRELFVVEVEESMGRGSTVQRLYFDETMNYACVAAERGRMIEGEFRGRSRWRFEDFREVRPGLFVPFSAVSEAVGAGARPSPAFTYTLLSMEFPTFFEEGLFELQFPDGTEVRDGIADLSYTIGEMPFDDLELLFVEIEETEPETIAPLPEPAPPVEPAPTPEPAEIPRQIPPLAVSILIAACVAAILAAIFVVVRRKRR